MKLRVKYTKTGSARFLSHLELMTAVERALRRAGVSLAFSQGFNPHPKISYASALPVGVASEAENLDVELSQRLETGQFLKNINNVSIAGLTFLDARTIPGDHKTKSLTAVIERARYFASAKSDKILTSAEIAGLVEGFLEQENIKVSRRTKNDLKEADIRDGIFDLELQFIDDCLELDFLVITGSKGNVRPEEVWEAFTSFAGLKSLEKPCYIRKELYALRDGKMVTPIQLLEGEEIVKGNSCRCSGGTSPCGSC